MMIPSESHTVVDGVLNQESVQMTPDPLPTWGMRLEEIRTLHCQRSTQGGCVIKVESTVLAEQQSPKDAKTSLDKNIGHKSCPLKEEGCCKG